MAGSKGKGNNTAGRAKVAKLPGDRIQCLNWGPEPWKCHQTGTDLPRKGFAWKYEDKLFADRTAINNYIKEKDV